MYILQAVGLTVHRVSPTMSRARSRDAAHGRSLSRTTSVGQAKEAFLTRFSVIQPVVAPWTPWLKSTVVHRIIERLCVHLRTGAGEVKVRAGSARLKGRGRGRAGQGPCEDCRQPLCVCASHTVHLQCTALQDVTFVRLRLRLEMVYHLVGKRETGGRKRGGRAGTLGPRAACRDGWGLGKTFWSGSARSIRRRQEKRPVRRFRGD